ncbi:MAG: hypothetical protein GYA14_00165 [Ignavibacteria bacterium]|nr:hypothetical protein [Ignavibacteria bacterium]
MKEKEIYKARAEGLKWIEENQQPVSDSEFLEFMSFVKEIVSQYQPTKEAIHAKIKEKCEDRIKLIQLFNK